ncbi:hypothetical protein GALMADRAFT_144758 [Galerina marginata CBS 339.88]|uniref:Uncharacterized protein n=1 Tax=Galerina marginata (strain CBS 339.88) TaxID=685588 RepID=A0A067SKF9_GALM3|nr:hypothetical protein GALMADRAFT_144758 [Galerina marginata CBS 339.88]
MDVDVDKDCLYILEEEMFERSARAGVAGHCQWGLDAGDHENWDPYEGIPPHFIHGDREESESELEMGPHYRSLPAKVALINSRPRPKPRPLGKKDGKARKA